MMAYSHGICDLKMKVTSTQMNPARFTLALPGFIALSLLLLLLPESGVEPLRACVRMALQPLLRVVARAPADAQPQLAAINVRIESDDAPQAPANSALESRAELERANAEIIRLRELLRRQAGEFAPQDAARREPPGIVADVIARRALWQEPVLGLNKGSADGVRMDAGVMHRGAVVGRIVACGPHASSMALLTHKGMSVGARLAESRAEGLLQGCRGGDASERLCRLQIVAKDLRVRVGEQLVTSGLDGCFPAGLWLGTVSAIKKIDGFQWELSIQPARDETSVETVRVLSVQPPEVPWPVLPERK